MYIDVKEAIKKYFLVKMKETCGDALSLEPILNFKKILKLVVTSSNLWAFLDFCTPSFFCVMIVMQNFILINNHIKPRPENQQKRLYWPSKFASPITLVISSHSHSSPLELITWFLSAVYRCVDLLAWEWVFCVNINGRSSRSPMLYKIDVIKNFARFTEKHNCAGVYFKIHLKAYFEVYFTAVFLWILWNF